jgi:hypothetical protein
VKVDPGGTVRGFVRIAAAALYALAVLSSLVLSVGADTVGPH